MPTQTEAAEWAEAYRLAWETADDEAAGALFTEDASYRSNIYEDAHLSREGVEDYWRTATAEQTNVSVRMGTALVSGSRVDVEFWTDMMIGGAPVTLAGCLLLTFDESGLCKELREYWHLVDGHHEPPSGWGT